MLIVAYVHSPRACFFSTFLVDVEDVRKKERERIYSVHDDMARDYLTKELLLHHIDQQQYFVKDSILESLTFFTREKRWKTSKLCETQK